MASKQTKIKRSIDEFKNFLDENLDNFHDTFNLVRPRNGVVIEHYADEVLQLIESLYCTLRNEIYPRLLDDNRATDTEIMDKFKGMLNCLEKSDELFQKIISKSVNSNLPWPVSSVYKHVLDTKYKLQEVISIAEDDCKNVKITKSEHNFDIGIVTATVTEHKSALALLKDYIRSPYDPNDSNVYYEGFFIKKDRRIKVVLTQTHHQGIPAATNTTTKLILKYNPKYMFMVGHLAGNIKLKGTNRLGHIIIGEESVDYQQNEVVQKKNNDSVVEEINMESPGNTNSQKKKEDVVIKEIDRKRSININSWLGTTLKHYGHTQSVLDNIKDKYTDKSHFVDPLKAYVGKIVSGSALLRASERFDEICNNNKGLLGLDTETHGFYYACENTQTANKPMFVSVKSISDHGEETKKSKEHVLSPLVRQEYACYTSVNFVYEFIMDILFE